MPGRDTHEKAALLLITLLILGPAGGLGLEFMLRAVRYRPSEEGLMRADPVLHHGFVPNARSSFRTREFSTSYAINSMGLRDREFSVPKPKGVFRIVVLGDSFAEGYAVEAEQSFPKVLEASLNEKGGRTYEVVNAGVRSHSPLLFYLSLKHKLLALDPDLVVLTLNVGDPKDDNSQEELAVWDEQGRPIACPPAPAKPSGSHFLPLPEGLRDLLETKTKVYPFLQSVAFNAGRVLKGEKHFTPGDPATDGFYLTRDPASKEAMLRFSAATQRNLIRIKDLLASGKIGLLVVTVPNAHLVAADEWSKGRRRWELKQEVYASEFFTLLSSWCREQGIAVLDTTLGLRREAEASKAPLYFPFDGHFTPLGNRVFAKMILDILVENKMRFPTRS